jgi:glycosyltransferase involved in cell wall biosynthesis
MNPLISIVIPTYQRCDRLKIALKSVLNQTYHNYEILIIDDGSLDGTKQMVKSFKDSRIIYHWQRNSGCPANPRNKGIKKAKGEWIAFLDSDDWWSPDKLKNCVKYINDDVDLIYHDIEIASNKPNFFLGGKKVKTHQLKTPVLKDLLLKGNIISNSSVVVRKKLLVFAGYLDERIEFKAVEDYNMWLKIARLTEKFFYLPKKLGFYFVHNENISNQKNISNQNISVPLKYAVSNFIKSLNLDQKIQLEANLRYISGRYHYLEKNFKNAKKDLIVVLKKGSGFQKFRSIFMIMMIFLRFSHGKYFYKNKALEKQSSKVSVIINCFNGQEYLRFCIESVLNQSFKNWEIIFWDNRSTDKSCEIIKSYKDKRIKYFKAKKHTLLYEARNLALKKANGKFITFLDVDDFWHKDNLKIKVRSLRGRTYSFAYSNFTLFNDIIGKYKNINIKQNNGNQLEQILKSYNIGFLTTIFKKEIFHDFKFNAKYHIIGDFDFIFRILTKHKFLFIKDKLCYYRIHGNNESRKKKKLHISELMHFINCNKNTKLAQKKNFRYVENLKNYYEGYYNLCKKNKIGAKKNLKKMFISFNKLKLISFFFFPNIFLKKLNIL